MKNLLKKLIIRKRDIIVAEADLTNVLKTISDYRVLTNVSIGVYEKSRSKWYIRFISTDAQWASIRSELLRGNFQEIRIRRTDYCSL